MIQNNILYIKRDNRATFVVETDKEYIVEKSIIRYMDEALWPCLSTFMGRKFSTQKTFNIRKATPIYFYDGIILQPVTNLDAWNLTYVNISNVRNFSKIGDKTKLIFINNKELIIDVPFARYMQFKSNCDIILKNQLNK